MRILNTLPNGVRLARKTSCFFIKNRAKKLRILNALPNWIRLARKMLRENRCIYIIGTRARGIVISRTDVCHVE